jgi:hypothetical protein
MNDLTDFQINLDNLYPKVWFGEEAGKRVCLCLCTSEAMEEFRKECTKTEKKLVQNKTSRKMEIVTDVDFDERKFLQLVNCHSIVDWDLIDVKGKPIPCTDENKIKLMGLIPFVKWIGECTTELAKQAGIQEEEELKNFESSQGE